jgi:site-specific recombinase XerC
MPYTLRDTFTSRYLETSGTLAELRDILGHTNIATADRYSHANARALASSPHATIESGKWNNGNYSALLRG